MTLQDVLAVFLFAIAIWCTSYIRKQHRLPPGPNKISLFRTRFKAPQVSAEKPLWKQYAELSKLYGPVVYLGLGKAPFIVINSAKSAVDLLNKRSRIYSDRQMTVMNSELTHRGQTVFLCSTSNPRLVQYQKMFREEMGVNSVHKHCKTQEQEAKSFLRNILNDSQYYVQHLKTVAGSIIMKVTYGYTVEPHNDPMIQLVRDWLATISLKALPGYWLVDSYPFLKYVPPWFPGTEFHQWASEQNTLLEKMISTPFEWTRRQMQHTDPTTINSFVASRLLAKPDGSNDAYDDVIRYGAAAMYVGGVDTAVSVLEAFILAMVLHPEVQRRAQEEIDQIVGPSRLPEIKDRPNMPYLNAVLTEVMRWSPIAPLGNTHRLTEDDVYDGMFIPAGTCIIPNIAAMLHDENRYPEPEKFNPERFLASDEVEPQDDPRIFIYGFGRRICPGRHFAESSSFALASGLLATFNILKAVDGEGNEITPLVQYENSFVSHPKTFPCRFVPKSEAAAQLLTD
ncbi:cytochrome P450 [Sistotremastrum suecicum HHB10207 ss-3]|uniref:Cytochrome P450 n=1 Tax=Sistotremastrum suecicum HHB10207 ss-3 TaxID=1314776 RepID=A0A166CAA9_9AGAM|nr:cytochrome P450 [Sistotremastrum suecicum HHB10207 ss-3]